MEYTTDSWIFELKRKIEDYSCKIGIVGLGYVGLPLAVAFSKKFKVVGYDINKEKIELLNNRESYIEDVRNEDIDLRRFQPTNDPSDLTNCDFIIITVPTPLREDKTPDLSYIKNSAKTVGKLLKRGQFVILESTTYPGTTEEVLVPILEEESGLKVIKDFGVAYSPERVDPGNKKYRIENTPKVVGGLTPEFTEIASMLYGSVIEKVVPVKDCKTAEAVKMLENVFRNVNIALVNELALIFEKMGIDIWEVIEAAKTKPYGFMAFYPGPGVGGHCIPLDPYYLSYRAKHFGIIPRFIEMAGEINDYMPIHTVNILERELQKIGKSIRGSNVLVLGLSYKPDIRDTRESPSIKIAEELIMRGAIVKAYDPHASKIRTRFGEINSEGDLISSIKWADGIIIAVNHTLILQRHYQIY
ncbi:nucleotide sugar dehydrogenase [Thermococcus sp. 2319x1]|uniref:nucleotide sugar dehydrogenase n=1 Tax=Thermococcus sp. 2319x1 TaxID=1674923 RepID=UPI0018D6158D|nr:nucleotide sugar dehydrogenase [Thermococcus sp. 2319x1]